MSLDDSLHSAHRFPLLHCQSMLSRLFKQLSSLSPKQAEKELRVRRRLMLQARNKSSYLSHSRSYQQWLSHEMSTSISMDVVPIWVFNFQETLPVALSRHRVEQQLQSRFRRAMALGRPPAHWNVSYHVGEPQRFHHRAKTPRSIWNKASLPHCATTLLYLNHISYL